ncbi:nucleoside-diphosphate kinase [Asanoa ferruginea]|uniref:nucleoside-diphosphate kinase n=1 Tax=Asanoa ferruginea TaxID=53367 RepID=UPI001EF37192|nr:nucleoside-diphosphate kinase [Asanoa ferruginea]
MLLKPDCVARRLVDQVLDVIGNDATIVDRRIVHPTADQIFAHYADLLTMPRIADFTWVDVHADVHRTYVGQPTGIALAHAPDAAVRLRGLIGHFDPAQASTDTIRGRFGTDSLARARAERRLIANVIHTSDDPVGARREFGIWYGNARAHLLNRAATTPAEGAPT